MTRICAVNWETPVVKTHREPDFLPGKLCHARGHGASHGAEICYGFFPLYRQEQVSRQTMSNRLLWAAEYLLTPVYDQLHKELLKQDVLHADETTLQVLHEPGKTARSGSYLWLYRTSGDTDRPIVLFDYQPERGACCPKVGEKEAKRREESLKKETDPMLKMIGQLTLERDFLQGCFRRNGLSVPEFGGER